MHDKVSEQLSYVCRINCKWRREEEWKDDYGRTRKSFSYVENRVERPCGRGGTGKIVNTKQHNSNCCVKEKLLKLSFPRQFYDGFGWLANDVVQPERKNSSFVFCIVQKLRIFAVLLCKKMRILIKTFASLLETEGSELNDKHTHRIKTSIRFRWKKTFPLKQNGMESWLWIFYQLISLCPSHHRVEGEAKSD